MLVIMVDTRRHAKKRQLSMVDWTTAALAALEQGGLSAVSVEGLARRLRTTKGSFYWHFASRDELLSAALARWEEEYTGRVIADLELVGTPRERLLRILRVANTSEASWRIHVALGASTGEPIVARALARVSNRRIVYLERCYRGLGLPAGRARQAALLAYAAYLGLLRLRIEAPDEVPRARRLEEYLASTIDALVPGKGGATEPRESTHGPRRGTGRARWSSAAGTR
jgi:AcrR family transcriptional regulator